MACQAALATQQEQLKQQLFSALEEDSKLIRTGKVTPQVEELIGQIKQAASEAPPRLQDIGVDGKFNGLLNTTNYLDDDACSTLGTITFQQFAPKDLKVQLSGTDVVTGIDSPDQYQTNAYFKILEGDAKGLLGIQSALGRYELDAEKADRQIVWFESIRIAPADKGPEALKQWLAVFKGENPNMGEDGMAQINFPNAAKGFRDFILVDDEVQVTVGNRGSVVVIRKK
ncbi:g779 [Coccomyxa viridis]|uniref:G779 protein n=1 Tax=Coccomyxa viridis TaxID=1274662 RepID=A0ABP1FJG7_9CHLO